MQDLPHPTLRTLLAQVSRHDEQATAALYRHYRPYVFGFVQWQFQLSYAVADEVLNDTFLSVFRKPDAYDFSSRFSSWLLGIARHKALTAGGRERRSQAHVSLDDEESLQVASLSATPLEALEEDEMREIMRGCYQRLGEDHRRTAQMVYCGEMKQDEVASLLGIPLGTVKSRLHQARAQLIHCVRRRFAGRGMP